MPIAAFLPLASADHVRVRLAEQITFANSWEELAQFISNAGVELVLVDPSAGGEMNLAAAARIQKTFQTTPFVAYVEMSHENMKAVFYLSGCGLRDVFLHPLLDDGRKLSEFARRQCGHRLAYEFLGLFETRLARLEPSLVSTVKDLFERPQRYETAADIGAESKLSTKCVYRALQKAGMGTPRKLVTVAKVLRGYAYLRKGGALISSISREIGYNRSRVFSQQVTDIFGCSPARIRAEANVEEVLLQLVEWLYKPDPIAQNRGHNGAGGSDLRGIAARDH